jgi:hypothetical protein
LVEHVKKNGPTFKDEHRFMLTTTPRKQRGGEKDEGSSVHKAVQQRNILKSGPRNDVCPDALRLQSISSTSTPKSQVPHR